MTEVEWTPNALDLLEGVESEAQERLVKKLDEANDWTTPRLEQFTGYTKAPDYLISNNVWGTHRCPDSAEPI